MLKALAVNILVGLMILIMPRVDLYAKYIRFSSRTRCAG
jgi:hypothetical protein